MSVRPPYSMRRGIAIGGFVVGLVAVALLGAFMALVPSGSASEEIPEPPPEAGGEARRQLPAEAPIPGTRWSEEVTSELRSTQGRSRHQILGRVVSETDSPVESATVCLLDMSGAVVSKTTSSSDGTFQLLSELPGDFLVANKATYEPVVSSLDPANDGREIILQLKSGGARLSGRVLRPDAKPALAGTAVLLWESRFPTPSWSAVGVDHAQNPIYRSTRTDADGNFTFAELQSLGRYRIIAGGQGYSSTFIEGETPSILPSETPQISLTVAPLYVIDLRWPKAVDTNSGGDIFSGYSTWWSKSPQSASLMEISLSSSLLRFLGIETSSRSGAGRQCLLQFFTSSLDRESIGPVELEVNAPGHISRRIDLFAHRVKDAAWPAQEVSLESSPMGVGTLQVRMRAATTEHTRVSLIEPTAWLRLEPAGFPHERNQRLSSPVHSITEGLLQIPGIPAGDYRIELDLRGRTIPTIPPNVSIRASENTIVDLDTTVQATGSLALTIERSSDAGGGNEYGPVVLTLGMKGRPGSFSIAFYRAPYVLTELVVGDYWITGYSLPGDRRSEVNRFSISAHEVTSTKIQFHP